MLLFLYFVYYSFSDLLLSLWIAEAQTRLGSVSYWLPTTRDWPLRGRSALSWDLEVSAGSVSALCCWSLSFWRSIVIGRKPRERSIKKKWGGERKFQWTEKVKEKQASILMALEWAKIKASLVERQWWQSKDYLVSTWFARKTETHTKNKARGAAAQDPIPIPTPDSSLSFGE